MGKNNKKRGRPNDPTYKAYRVTSPAHGSKIVFAAGIWSAVGMLLQWRVANGIGEVPFTLDPTWAQQLTGIARKHIDEARAFCREAGIGTSYRADMGWGIGGPDDERDEPG